jgi:polyhydroxybutyrate depolymerase
MKSANHSITTLRHSSLSFSETRPTYVLLAPMRGTLTSLRRWGRSVAIPLSLVGLFTGLSVSSHVTTVAAATTTPSGCGSNAFPGTYVLTKKFDGHQRVVLVHVPSHYVDAKVALVLNLHGSESTAQAQEKFTGMDVTADAHTFIVAYPQALIPSGTGFDWNVPNVPLSGGAKAPAGAANDVTFLEDVVKRLEAKYCINPHEVYATGMSGGGRMASQLGCDASNVFAAVAPVAGLRYPAPCPATRAVPVVAFHGTADRIDPYKGNGQAYWTYSVKVAASRWAGHDACATPATVTSHHGYSLTSYATWKTGADVELYSLKGEGHEWPGGPSVSPLVTDVLGPQSNAVNANDVMWTFFTQHTLEATPKGA